MRLGPVARGLEARGPGVREARARVGEDAARVAEGEHADGAAVVALAVVGGPALLAVVALPAARLVPGGTGLGVEDDPGLRRVLALAVDRHHLAGVGRNLLPQPVPD